MKVVCKSASIPYPDRILWFRVDGSGDEITLIPAAVCKISLFFLKSLLLLLNIKGFNSSIIVCNNCSLMAERLICILQNQLSVHLKKVVTISGG